MIERSVRKLTKNINSLFLEIKDYFKNKEDEDYLVFDEHPLSNAEALMDRSKPAPWDHLNNSEDDEDIDIEIEGVVQ